MLGQPSRQSIDLYYINFFGSLVLFYGNDMSCLAAQSCTMM
jgi:hypothetical protein